MTVVTALAVSWKPLMNSKPKAIGERKRKKDLLLERQLAKRFPERSAHRQSPVTWMRLSMRWPFRRARRVRQ